MHRQWPLASALARTLIGCVLLVAVTGKFTSASVDSTGVHSGVAGFARTIQAQSVIPASWAYPAAVGILLGECVLALVGLCHLFPRAWAWGCIALFAVFSIYLVVLATKGVSASCPCFGVFGGSSLVSAMARNALLSALASLSLLPSASRGRAPRPASGLVPVAAR